jgi:adenylate cyclase
LDINAFFQSQVFYYLKTCNWGIVGFRSDFLESNMQFGTGPNSEADAQDTSSVAEQAELEHVLFDPGFAASARRKNLLRYLVQESLAGRADLLTAVPIAQSVFGRDETFDHQSDPVVRVEARRLRHDLDRYYADAGKARPLRIRIPKGGYAVQFVPQPNQDASEEPAVNQTGRRYRPGPRTALMVAATLGLFMAVTAVWQGYFREPEPPASSSAVNATANKLPKGLALAVVPFLNVSGSSEKQYVSDGITQQIATELARFEQLWVLPLGSLQDLKEGAADPHEIQREFGAAYVLEGSVRMSEDTIRITSRLIETETSRYVWVKNFKERLTPANIYDVQDAIAQEVAANLGGKYGFLAKANTARSNRKAPESLEAYDCVLRYYDYQSSINPGSYPAVKRCLEKAVTIEPDYAEAWAVLANLYMQEVRFGYGDRKPDDATAAAKRAAERALEIDPQSTTGNIILANILFTEGDLNGFRELGERALISNPNDSDVLAHFGLRLALSGDWDHGLPLLEKAVRLNPTFPSWHRFAFAIYHYDRGEYELALEEVDKINMPGFFWTYLLRVAVLGQLGRTDEANEAARQLLDLDNEFPQRGLFLINAWQFPEPLSKAIVEGLEKAGLRLVDKAT